jgi:D-glycero-beta-D-manno-heptose-7-phosphate kinase
MLARARAQELMAAFAGKRILVIGDLMLDRYIYGSVRRISPEAPVPVVTVTSEKAMPGGASNVAWNIQTLGGRGDVSGVVGDDPDGRELLRLLEAGGVGIATVRTDADARTTVKTRIIAERQQVVRVDWERTLTFSEPLLDGFCEQLRAAIADADGVIIEDYGKGLVRQEVVHTALAAAQATGIPVGYDPKDDHQLDVRGVTVATPNRKEAYAAIGRDEPITALPPLRDPDLQAVGEQLRAKWGVKLLMITLGPQGMFLLEEGQPPAQVPTRAREVYDVSGAGDTVIATCTLALAAGATHREAAELANYAAGVVVAQLGTAPCRAADLMEAIP